MAIQIKKAIRERVFLKLVAMGPAGSGKTYGTIGLAKGLAPTGKVLVVDTENASASYYADKWDFDVVDMHAPFTPQKYMEVLAEAVRLGYEVIVFDSLSHEWAGSGGTLDKKADIDRAKGEKWGNWQDAKKPHTLFKEAWLQAPIHVVATMRSKMEYVLELNEKGKQVPRKVGLAPIQDGDSEYEFGVAFEIDRDSHLATAAKDRTGLFDGRSFPLGEAIGQELAAWLASGAPMTIQDAAPAAPEPLAPAHPAATAPPLAPTHPTQAVPAAPAAPRPSSPTSPAAPARTAPSRNAREKAQPMDEAWIAANVELAEVTLPMPAATRNALVKHWSEQDPAQLPELLKEIEMIRNPGSVGAALLQIAPPRPEPPAENFADEVSPDTDEAGGGISDEEYMALGMLIESYHIDRDRLRAYLLKTGGLLPGKNGPTLARTTASAFTKLKEDLYNTRAASPEETWSQLRVRRINSTTLTVYQPVPAAS